MTYTVYGILHYCTCMLDCMSYDSDTYSIAIAFSTRHATWTSMLRAALLPHLMQLDVP